MLKMSEATFRPKPHVAAVTHVRKDDFYLELWLRHYGGLLGRENCTVILDGDDWQSNVDLNEVNVETVHGRLGLRVRDDARMAEEATRVVSRLFEQGYRYVLRSDCDEFVIVDPATGLTFWEALLEADELGYIYCRGLDIVQDLDLEPPLNTECAILGQRSFGVIQRHFFKPIVLSRPMALHAGGHAVAGVVRVSSALVLLHLANADGAAMQARFAARRTDDESGSYNSHLAWRGAISEVMNHGVEPADFDHSMQMASEEIASRGSRTSVFRPQKFKSGNVMLGKHNAYFVKLPERFSDLLLLNRTSSSPTGVADKDL